MQKLSFIAILIIFIQFKLKSQTFGISYTYKLGEVIDKKTGKIIHEDTLKKLITNNRNLVLERVINEYGNITRHVYDPELQNGNYNPRDTSLRTKVGHPILPFIFKPLNADTIYSKNLKDRVVILAFYTRTINNFKIDNLKEFIDFAHNNTKICSLIISSSSEAETQEFINTNLIKLPVVADAHNFFE